MLQVGRRWMVALLGGCVMAAAGCAAVPQTPSLFPVLTQRSPAARAQVVQERATSVQTLSALLAVSYSRGSQHGTFDLIVNYAAPSTLRFTALKDTVLHTKMLFDLLVQQETYRFVRYEDAGALFQQGLAQDFLHDHPMFRTFVLVGEAFLVPGVAHDGQPPQVNNAGTRLRTALRHGVHAQWRSHAETLEIFRACLRMQTAAETIALTLDYREYRRVDTHYLPHQVTLHDRRAGFTVHAVVKEVTVNEPLAPDVFVLTP